jgi:hypothetical protein
MEIHRLCGAVRREKEREERGGRGGFIGTLDVGKGLGF